MQRRRQAGFSLLEVLVVAAVISILVAIAIPMMKDALRRAKIRAGAADARSLYMAFKQYRIDHSMYPGTTQLDTFEPLVTSGYYGRKGFGVGLVGGQADGYGSPDDGGPNQEFWIEMTLEYDPTVRFLVCDSNNSTLGAGSYYDGVYVFENGSLMPL